LWPLYYGVVNEQVRTSRKSRLITDWESVKSKKPSKITSGKSRLEEEPIFFLDRTFGREKLAMMLRQEGFHLVTHFEEYGIEKSAIGDPAIIFDCGLKNRVLITGDQNMIYAYAKEIIDARIAVFVTTDNNEGPSQWAPRIIGAKSDIWRELKRRQKPFTARISNQGRITQVRIYAGGRWKTIQIGKKNPAHESKYKKQA